MQVLATGTFTQGTISLALALKFLIKLENANRSYGMLLEGAVGDQTRRLAHC